MYRIGLFYLKFSWTKYSGTSPCDHLSRQPSIRNEISVVNSWLLRPFLKSDRDHFLVVTAFIIFCCCQPLCKRPIDMSSLYLLGSSNYTKNMYAHFTRNTIIFSLKIFRRFWLAPIPPGYFSTGTHHIWKMSAISHRLDGINYDIPSINLLSRRGSLAFYPRVNWK